MRTGRPHNHALHLPAIVAAPVHALSRHWHGLLATVLCAVLLAPLVSALAESITPDAAAYLSVWGRARSWHALGTTLGLGATAASMALLLGWIMAGALALLPARLKLVGALCCGLPLLLPSSLLAGAWIVALGRDGLLRAPWEAATGLSWTIYDRPMAAAAMALRYFGPAVWLLLEDRRWRGGTGPAAQLMVPSRTLRWLVLRLWPAARTATMAWLIVLLLVMNDHIMPDVFLISTYGTQILIQYAALLSPAGATALAAIPTAACAAVAWLALGYGWGRWRRSAGDPSPPARQPPAAHALAGALVLTVLFVAVLLPVGVLARRAGWPSAWLAALGAAGPELLHTATLAGLGAPASVLAAWVIATAWLRRAKSGRWSLAPCLLVNLAAPASLVALGTLALTAHGSWRGLANGPGAIVLACMARFCPIAVLMLFAAWIRHDDLPEQCARAHGMAPWRRGLHVLWPRRRRVVGVAILLNALLIATELEMSILLVAPGTSTLGVRLYTLMHTAPDELVSALAMGIASILLPAIVVFVWLVAGRDRHPGFPRP